MRRFDAIVVGCGVFGASVSYNLAKRGLRVLTLEQYGLNHKLGSSHGGTRIIRLAYYEDPRYVPLLRRAYQTWRMVEKESGKELLRETGGLMIGGPEEELVAGVLASASAHDLDYRVLSAKEVREEFGVFKLDEGQVGVYEPTAGILFAEECVRAFVTCAEKSGCEFSFSEPVKSWKSDDEGLVVETSQESYSAEKVVFCAGPWTGSLVPDLVPLKIERQVPFWFASGGEPRYLSGVMPVFIYEDIAGVFYYGIPDVGEGVKVARTHAGQIVEPDTVERGVTAKDSQPVEEFVNRRLVGLRTPAISSTTCLYSNTPDLNFAVGLHPEDSRVAIVSACSGHGFKFAGVLGEAAAELVVDGRTTQDIGFLSLSRFGSGSAH